MPPRWWDLLQERGGKWPDRALERDLDPIVPACETHEWGPWREASGFFCGAGGGHATWQSARCRNCGRMGVREIFLRRGSRSRVLGEISVTESGAVRASMVRALRESLLFW